MPTIHVTDLNAAKLQLAQLTDFTTPLKFTGISLGYSKDRDSLANLLKAIPVDCKSLDLSEQDLSQLSLSNIHWLANCIPTHIESVDCRNNDLNQESMKVLLWAVSSWLNKVNVDGGWIDLDDYSSSQSEKHIQIPYVFEEIQGNTPSFLFSITGKRLMMHVRRAMEQNSKQPDFSQAKAYFEKLATNPALVQAYHIHPTSMNEITPIASQDPIASLTYALYRDNQLGHYISPLSAATIKNNAITSYCKAITQGIISTYCVIRLISLINEGVHNIRTAFLVGKSLPSESSGIDEDKLFSPSIKQEVVKVITETIDKYIETNLSYKYTFSFSANHGIDGRRRAKALKEDIKAAKSIPETGSILINFLKNKKNGNLWPESLRVMLLDQAMLKFDILGHSHEPITSKNFDQYLKSLSDLLPQDKTVKASEEEATTCLQNLFCSFG